MEKFANRIERILTPFGAKLQNVTFMQAISESLQATLPILIVGSFATLISSLDVGPWQGIVKSIPGLIPVCQKITSFTSGGFTLLMLIALAQLYCKKIEVKEYISCTALTVAVFLILSEVTDGNIASSALGMRGMILALFVGILVPKSVQALIDRNVRIRMPGSSGNVARPTCFNYFSVYSAAGINSKRRQSGSMEFRGDTAKCN